MAGEGHETPDAMQHFLSRAGWNADAVVAALPRQAWQAISTGHGAKGSWHRWTVTKFATSSRLATISQPGVFRAVARAGVRPGAVQQAGPAGAVTAAAPAIAARRPPRDQRRPASRPPGIHWCNRRNRRSCRGVVTVGAVRPEKDAWHAVRAIPGGAGCRRGSIRRTRLRRPDQGSPRTGPRR